jgi:hypothetical protein
MLTDKKMKKILEDKDNEKENEKIALVEKLSEEKDVLVNKIIKEHQDVIDKIKSNNKKTVTDIKKSHKKDMEEMEKNISEKVSKSVEKILADERSFAQKKREVIVGDSFYDDNFYVYESYDDSMQDAVKMNEKEFLKKYKNRIVNKDDVKLQLAKIREGDTGWTQLGLGTILDIQRYQSLTDLWSMQDAAYNKSRKNPIARSIVNTIQHYTVGRGLKFEASDHKVQQFLMDFWASNKMDLRQKELVKSTYIEGEYFILYFISELTGQVKVRRIRPKEIDSIESHPDDIETILAYKRVLKSWDSRRAKDGERHYADVDYFTRLEDKDNIDRQEAMVHKNLEKDKLIQFIKYNDNPDEVRGRVPMDSVMKYLKYYEDWLLDRVRLNHERSKVVWIKTIRGRGTETSVTRTRSPKGGQILQETNNIKYRIENANINADRAADDGLSILYSIGSGVTIPLHILNQRGDQENYSSIRKMDSPFSQGMIFNQDFWVANFDKMFRVAINAGVKSTKLDKQVKVPRFKKEKVFEAMRLINEMVLDKKPQDKIIKEARKILLVEGEHKMLTIPTEEIPITKIFPEVFREDAFDQARVLGLHKKMGIVSNQTLSELSGYNWLEELFRMKSERDAGIGVEEDPELDKNKKNKIVKKNNGAEDGE